MNVLDLPDLRLHYLRQGGGPPLVFLHGWPEWSGVWRKNLPVLAETFDVIAPDLRNFGDSRGAEARDVAHYVSDIEALVDGLGLDRFGIVSHDIGGFLAQDYARKHPDRLAGLFFFDCPHFGIGPRWVQGQQVREIWYQSFHQLPLAQELVGASRESCRAYFRHFLGHWAGSPDAFDGAALEDWVDNFLKPGNLTGGFRWYACANDRRLKAVAAGGEDHPPLSTPAYSLWGAADPILRPDWQDTLTDVFTDIQLEQAPGAGHFVAWESPDLANARIRAFFDGRFALS
ncbi:MAG TPA: alpha/beta hydrolase [Rhodospirillaceae bacterium]|nr:alpha/beta hydrolase [Rhodospirillaceae bacterium]